MLSEMLRQSMGMESLTSHDWLSVEGVCLLSFKELLYLRVLVTGIILGSLHCSSEQICPFCLCLMGHTVILRHWPYSFFCYTYLQCCSSFQMSLKSTVACVKWPHEGILFTVAFQVPLLQVYLNWTATGRTDSRTDFLCIPLWDRIHII